MNAKIFQVAVRFQVIDEAAHPRSASRLVGPKRDVFVHAFENRPAQFGFRHKFVNGVGPLAVKRAVIFRHGVLAVAFFADFDSDDGITALVDVSDFIGGIFRRAINRGAGTSAGWPIVNPLVKKLSMPLY